MKVTYDPSKVTYGGLIEWLIKHSDPTDSQGSFHDRGVQYRPVVYHENEQEKQAAEKVIAEVKKLGVYDKPLDLEVAKREKFWPAEDYHQDYAKNSLVKYDYYRYQSGRDAFIEKHWGDRATKLELPSSIAEAKGDSDKTLTSTPADEPAENDTVTIADSVGRPWKDFRKPSKQESKELGDRGIAVNSVQPGATVPGRLASSDDERKEQFRQMSPFKRPGNPKDIAAVVSFLAGDDGRWVTGQHLRADGGASN